MSKPKNYLENHLPYELTMMEHTFARLHDTKDDADRNAFLESFCVHAPNLKMFLTGDRGGGSNGVISADFGQSSDSVQRHLTGAFQRLNEQIAHLAKNRTILPQEKFTSEDAVCIMKWIIPAMDRFVKNLPDEDRQRWEAVVKKLKRKAIPHSGLVTAMKSALSTATPPQIVVIEIPRL
jgi:hypothetical protein